MRVRTVRGRAAVLDETEFIEQAVMPSDEALHLVLTSEIRAAMTVLAVLLVARRHITPL